MIPREYPPRFLKCCKIFADGRLTEGMLRTPLQKIAFAGFGVDADHLEAVIKNCRHTEFKSVIVHFFLLAREPHAHRARFICAYSSFVPMAPRRYICTAQRRACRVRHSIKSISFMADNRNQNILGKIRLFC